MKCPATYAYGGTPRYGHFEHETIPSNSELTFELEVLECQPTVDKINDKNEAAGNRALRVSMLADDQADSADDEEDTFKKKSKKDLKAAQEKIKGAKDKIKEQKHTVQNQQGDIKDNENDIKSSTTSNQKKQAEQMLKNEEKVVNEKAIIKKEKDQVKSAKKALVDAEKKLRTKPTKIVVKPKPPKKEIVPENTMKSQSCFSILYKGATSANGEQMAGSHPLMATQRLGAPSTQMDSNPALPKA